MLDRIDTFLFEKFQNLQDYLQYWTSITCFTLAKMCMLPVLIGNIFIIKACLSLGLPLFFWFFIICIPILCCLFYSLAFHMEKTLTGASSAGNIFELLFRLLRKGLVLFIFLLELYVFFCAPDRGQETYLLFCEYLLGCRIMLWAFVAYFYFMSCTPKPPKTSKVKKLLKNLFSPKSVLQISFASCYAPHLSCSTVPLELTSGTVFII